MKSPVDLHLLRVLIALHSVRRVGAVAKNMHMSQPAVSQALLKLRQAFNDPLFVKTQGGMKPTTVATGIVESVKDAVQLIELQVRSNIAFDPSHTRRTFTLALSDIGEPLILPKLAERIRTLAPHAKLETVSPPLVDIEHGMETGDIDLVLGYRPDLKRSHYFQQKLFSAGYVCLVRKTHPIVGMQLTAKRFVEMEHILVRADNRAQEELEQFLTRRKLRRQIRIYTPHFTTIPLLISKSDLIVTLPRFLANHMERLYPDISVVEPQMSLPILDEIGRAHV